MGKEDHKGSKVYKVLLVHKGSKVFKVSKDLLDHKEVHSKLKRHIQLNQQ